MNISQPKLRSEKFDNNNNNKILLFTNLRDSITLISSNDLNVSVCSIALVYDTRYIPREELQD